MTASEKTAGFKRKAAVGRQRDFAAELFDPGAIPTFGAPMTASTFTDLPKTIAEMPEGPLVTG
jgi:hypothetical protein